ncbi:hypothetical protein NQZ68_004453 [Dissostichus eleginoides]|nr:hypothetical protein NQZ68_004453 [Dissostichus eleginoides]
MQRGSAVSLRGDHSSVHRLSLSDLISEPDRYLGETHLAPSQPLLAANVQSFRQLFWVTGHVGQCYTPCSLTSTLGLEIEHAASPSQEGETAACPSDTSGCCFLSREVKSISADDDPLRGRKAKFIEARKNHCLYCTCALTQVSEKGKLHSIALPYWQYGEAVGRLNVDVIHAGLRGLCDESNRALPRKIALQLSSK